MPLHRALLLQGTAPAQSRARGRGYLWAGIGLCLLGLAINFVQFFALKKFFVPWYMPVMATLAVFSFLNTWNDFLWPLITIYSPQNMTIQLGLATFQGAHQTNTNLLMAANVMSMLPVLLLFFVAQRYFVRGIATTGLKG